MVVSFAKRRPLFALALLGAVRPGDAPRDMLVAGIQSEARR